MNIKTSKSISIGEFLALHPQEIQNRINRERNRVREILRPAVIHKPQPVKNLDEARHALKTRIQTILSEPAQQRFVVIACPTGLGKTTAAINALTELMNALVPLTCKDREMLVSQSKLNKKVLILVQKKEDAQKIYQQVRAQVFNQEVMLIEGRTADPKSLFFCPKTTLLLSMAKNRHPISCDCHLWPLGPCPYRTRMNALRHLTEQNRGGVVVSTYSSFINEGDGLLPFDTIIIDESVTQTNIAECVQITPDDICQHAEKAHTEYPKDHPFFLFLDALYKITGPKYQHERQSLNFHEIWRDVYQGPALLDLLASLHCTDNGLYSLLTLEDNTLVKRFVHDLICAIENPNLVISLDRQCIEFYRPTMGLAYLQTKEVINLDATPNETLLHDVFDNVDIFGAGSNLTNVQVIQVLGRVNTSKSLMEYTRKTETIAIVEHLYNQYQKKAPLTVVHKRFASEAIGNEHLPEEDLIDIEPDIGKTGYWGKHTRGSNDFQDRDGIALIGHYQIPPNQLAMKVNAIRRSMAVSGPSEKRPVAMALVGHSKMVPVRFQHTHPDPLIQATIEHELAAEVIQAIGRLRAISRPGETLHAFIINGTILKGVLIDEVLSTQTLLKELGYWNAPKKPQALKLKDARITFEKLTLFLNELESSPGLSQNELIRRTSLAKGTVRRYLKAYRELMQGGSRTTHDIYISLVRDPLVSRYELLEEDSLLVAMLKHFLDPDIFEYLLDEIYTSIFFDYDNDALSATG